MSDLVQELKARLRIEEVVCSYGGVCAQGELKGRGRELFGAKNDSLKVYPFKGTWCWFSRAKIGGDVLSWIAYVKFGRTDVDGEDFVEVLREGCGLAGIAFPEQDSRKDAKAQSKRKLEEILERYVALCESLRDAEFFVQARQRKAWLTPEICERWRLGRSATPAEWRAAGLNDDEMKAVNLYRHSADRAGEWYPFFRESIVIPTLYRGRVQYLSSRYLKDTLPSGALREKKTLHMPSLDLLPRPAGFNLDVLHDPETREKGVRLVEAPLDAVRACEEGKPAVAMYGSTPAEELVRVLRKVA